MILIVCQRAALDLGTGVWDDRLDDDDAEESTLATEEARLAVDESRLGVEDDAFIDRNSSMTASTFMPSEIWSCSVGSRAMTMKPISS